jgi:hypothetical protein
MTNLKQIETGNASLDSKPELNNKNSFKKSDLYYEMWDYWINYEATLPDLNLNTELDNKCFDDSICGLNGVYCILCVSKSSNIKT